MFERTGRTGFYARAALYALIDVGHGGLPINNLETLSGTGVLTLTVAIAEIMVDIDLTTDVFAFPALDYHCGTSGKTG
jgi:hypothetical protein